MIVGRYVLIVLLQVCWKMWKLEVVQSREDILSGYSVAEIRNVWIG